MSRWGGVDIVVGALCCIVQAQCLGSLLGTIVGHHFVECLLSFLLLSILIGLGCICLVVFCLALSFVLTFRLLLLVFFGFLPLVLHKTDIIFLLLLLLLSPLFSLFSLTLQPLSISFLLLCLTFPLLSFPILFSKPYFFPLFFHFPFWSSSLSLLLLLKVYFSQFFQFLVPYWIFI